jgi:hypothetical protein
MTLATIKPIQKILTFPGFYSIIALGVKGDRLMILLVKVYL